MKDRLVDSVSLMEAYGVTHVQTLIRWTKRDSDKNPLPLPVKGGTGQGNRYKWLRSQLIVWEIEEFGAELEM